jgi:cyclic beta-1,2-glucan synthetase
MFANGADALSRASGGAWLRLRAKLHYSAGWLLRPWSAVSPRTHDDPIRAELFGIERLELHAESLAAAQHTTSKPTTDRRLEARLRDNDRALRSAYHAIIAATRQTRAITPAAEWLLDNFHLVEEQVRAIRIDLPPGFHRQLPKLIDGPLKG